MSRATIRLFLGLFLGLLVPILLAARSNIPLQDRDTETGKWVLVQRTERQAHYRYRRTVDDILGYLYAFAEVDAGPDSCAGLGEARDSRLFDEALAIAVETGLLLETWQYVDLTKMGRASVSAKVEMDGHAHLIDPDCAAAALGYVEFESSITKLIRAELTKSAAETSKGQLGSISASFKGVGVTIPIQVGLGIGSYPDFDADATFGAKDTDFFFRKHRTHPYIKVWANGWWDSHAEAEVWGSVESQIELS